MTFRCWTLSGFLVTFLAVCCHGQFLRVCYLASWSQHRPSDARFTVANISDVNLCTHIVVAFAEINTTDNTLIPLEQNDDIPPGTHQQLAQLRDSNPGMKVLLAVGGRDHGTEPFKNVVSDTDNINVFTDNVVSYIRGINFDGVDIHWVWPAQRGGNSSDKEGFTKLLQTLRSEIGAESSRTGRPALLLTAAVSASQLIINAGYEVDKISRLVDFLSVMTYDMDVSRGSRLLHHAPLYSRPEDPQEDKQYNIDFAVNYWLNKGAPRNKVVVGLPFYGRYYRLISPFLTDLYDAANGSSSVYPYYQICQFVHNPSWTYVWDDVTKVPAIYSNEKWIGYDDIRSMAMKATYIRQESLGGAMIWAMDQDDFGEEFCNQEPYPLLKKINEVLTGSKGDCGPGTYGSLSESDCTPCPRGSYQPQRRRTKCELCGSGTTTYTQGAKAEYRCVETCSVGYEYNYLKKMCMKCRLGFTRSQLSSAYCMKCPVDHTTMTEGDTTCVPLPEGVPAPEVMDLMYHFSLTFMTTTCGNYDVIFGAISAGVWKVVSDASVTWPQLCSRGCDNVKTLRVEGCEEVDRRKKRDSHLTRLTVRALIEEVPEEIRSTSDASDVTVTRTADSVMVELFFDRDLFNTLNVYGIQYSGMTERTLEKLCSQTGYVFEGGQCVPCPAGSYKQRSTRRCAVCSGGQYQENEAQTQCKECPGPMTTLDTGVDSLTKCLSPCAVDTNYCENNGVCQWRQESLKVFCQCAEPYFGERCDMRADRDTEDLVPVIGGVVGGLGSLIAVCIIMGVCCLCYRRQAKNQRNSSPVDDSNDVMYASGVMTSDYLPTPTVIAADPYYYDNAVIMSDNYRSRALISDDTFRTPSIIQLDTDTPYDNAEKQPKSKTNGNKKANVQAKGSKLAKDETREHKLASIEIHENKRADDKTEQKTHVGEADNEEDKGGVMEPASLVKDKALGQRL